MKELLTRLAKYNIWANQKFINVLEKLSEEQTDMEIESSFSSIRKTVYHMWSAEYIWIQRLELVEKPVWIQDSYDGDLATALENWKECSAGLLSFIEKQFDDDAFTHVMQYYNLKKQSVKLEVSTGLIQVLNHATYHRGQLVTMLRQAGIKKVPSTDYYLFAKK
ncbi:MAG: DinB family protein [Chitinophagales bacterium]|nr:DinB family protein [Chitinophagales bacterium]